MKNTLNGFKQFILRGNVVDLAVGVVIGAAFTSVVNALVKGIITPLIGAFARVPDFSELIVTINGSKFMYGEVINALLSFLIVASTIYFFIIIPINALVARTRKDPPTEPSLKKCPECLSDVPKDASRCSQCTQKIA